MPGTRKYLLFSILPALFLISWDALAQRYAVSGYVVDAATKETLIGAVVIHQGSGHGVVTDTYGYFQMAGLQPGKQQFVFSFVGYEPLVMEAEIKNKSYILGEIRLQPKPFSVEEVSIIAARPDIAADRQVETSMIELSAKTIKSIPTAGNDVFSAIKFLPGVDRTEPFSPLYTVRGGEPGENAVLLDGVMIYNPYHSSISSGIFNTQIIKNVDLLIGGFGAEYGGRNSSVMYISTIDGNSSEIHGEIEPSTFHSKIFLEFPAGEKGSAVVAGRYFYDIFSEFLFQAKSYFYDFNLSYTYRINERNRLSFKYFQSRDRNNTDFNTFYRILGNTAGIDIYDDFDFQLVNRWKNYAGTVIHKWVISPRIYLRSQVYYSSHQSDNYSGVNFRFDFSDEHTDTLNFELNTNSSFTNQISDLCAKSFVNIMVSENNNLRLGAEFNRYSFENNVIINDVNQGDLRHSPIQYSAFAEDKWVLGPAIVRPGIRFTRYDNNDWNYEPRINAVVSLPFKMRLRAAWGTYYQHIISMNTNEVEMNQEVDYYFPLRNYPPSKSVHYIIGIEKQLNQKSMISLDLYYKDIERVYTFDINQTGNELLLLSDRLQEGSGEAYGGELMLQGGTGNVSGWVSYGLAWATRQYPQINGGEEYPYDYNRRHTIKLVANCAISSSLEYNVSFMYMSGAYRSIEQTLQNYYYYNPETENLSFFPVWIPEGKNTSKMPPLIDLDMSLKKRLRSGFGKQIADKFNARESYLTVTFRNITFFRRNVEYYFPISGIGRWEGKYLPVGTNYLPMIGLSYTIKF
jgi:hypothetical protein